MDKHNRVGTVYAERYEIREVIGEGGMGTIYDAKHKFTGQVTALKILHPKVANTDELAERFVREARAPMQVQHPGLVPVFDAGRGADGSLYLAMEKLNGVTLKQALIEKRIDYRSLVTHTVEVLDALQAAHAAGVIHRDIKPGNIFLSKQGDTESARLLDFGVTRLMDGRKSVTAPGRTVGTPYFMAPEQALGGLVDARSDIWSVGAVLYTGLCGHPPFANDDLAVAVQELVSSSPLSVRTVNSKVPQPLGEVVDRSLRKNPNERWNSAGAMANALRSCIGDERIASWEATMSNVELPSDQRLSAPGGLAPVERNSKRATKPERIMVAEGRARREKKRLPWLVIALIAGFAAMGITFALVGAFLLWGSSAESDDVGAIPAPPALEAAESSPSEEPALEASTPEVSPGPPMQPSTR